MFPDLDYGAASVVRAGSLVFLTGQTGFNLNGTCFVGEGDPAAQAEHAMQCVNTLLKETGSRIADICKITTYVTEREYRHLVYPVIARHLRGVYPASTGLVVKALAEPYVDFEIDVFPVISEERVLTS
jgi:enamine deaminase RidA (YjgF/YER057c/UK114 family)